jgi:hypothetical protein
MTPIEKRQRFRALLIGQSCVHPADPLSARRARGGAISPAGCLFLALGLEPD